MHRLVAVIILTVLLVLPGSIALGGSPEPARQEMESPDLLRGDPERIRRAVQAAEYIMRCQDAAGAIHDASDSTAINMDNNMGYALLALAAVYERTGDQRYLDAVRRGLVWLASVQEADGAWHWGYMAPSYAPYVGEYYRAHGITGIKGVDAIQAYFAYLLELYVRLSGDRAFGDRWLPTARRGIHFLLTRSYDGRFFYSSWQRRRGGWWLLREQYSAGQGDVYLGLMGLWQLTGDEELRSAALRLRQEVGAYLVASAWGKSLRVRSPYPFSNGYLPYVFRVPDGLEWLARNQDGTAIAATSLAMGLQANSRRADGPLSAMRELQAEHGGIAFSRHPPYDRYFYTNTTAFAAIAWTGVRFAIPLTRPAF